MRIIGCKQNYLSAFECKISTYARHLHALRDRHACIARMPAATRHSHEMALIRRFRWTIATINATATKSALRLPADG